MARKPVLALVPIVLALAAVVWFLLHGFGRPAAVPEAERAGVQARYLLRGVDWTRYDPQGVVLLHAQAATVHYFDDRSARLADLKMDKLGGEGPWTLTSPSGLMPAHQQRVQLMAPVLVEGTLRQLGPVQIEATTLWVDSERREIYTSDSVKLTGPGRSASALGLRADWAGERLQLLNRVQVEYVQRRS